MKRKCLLVGLALGMLASAPVAAGPAPFQRGEVMPPAAPVATAVVTVCGLAVMLVVQPRGAQALLYASDAMAAKIRELGIRGDQRGHYELAELYAPVASACSAIRAEHDRLLRSEVFD